MRSERNFFKAVYKLRVNTNHRRDILDSYQIRVLKYYWSICGRVEMWNRQAKAFLKWEE